MESKGVGFSDGHRPRWKPAVAKSTGGKPQIMPSNSNLFAVNAAPNLPVPSVLIGARVNDFSVRLIRNERLAPVFGVGITGCNDNRRRW